MSTTENETDPSWATRWKTAVSRAESDPSAENFEELDRLRREHILADGDASAVRRMIRGYVRHRGEATMADLRDAMNAWYGPDDETSPATLDSNIRQWMHEDTLAGLVQQLGPHQWRAIVPVTPVRAELRRILYSHGSRGATLSRLREQLWTWQVEHSDTPLVSTEMIRRWMSEDVRQGLANVHKSPATITRWVSSAIADDEPEATLPVLPVARLSATDCGDLASWLLSMHREPAPHRITLSGVMFEAADGHLNIYPAQAGTGPSLTTIEEAALWLLVRRGSVGATEEVVAGALSEVLPLRPSATGTRDVLDSLRRKGLARPGETGSRWVCTSNGWHTVHPRGDLR
jgi:hypothetical protein